MYTTIVSNKQKKNGLYMTLHNEDVWEAARTLKPAAFKVWLWLASFGNGYRIRYLPAWISKTLGISQQAATKAIGELMDAGYLAAIDGELVFGGGPNG